MFNGDIYVCGPSQLYLDSDTLYSVAKYINGSIDTCGFFNVGVENPDFSEIEMLVYPNPTANTFTISAGTTENYSFEVFNGIGQVVQTGSFKQIATVNSESWQTGLYFIRISDGKHVWNEKLVKQ